MADNTITTQLQRYLQENPNIPEEEKAKLQALFQARDSSMEPIQAPALSQIRPTDENIVSPRIFQQIQAGNPITPNQEQAKEQGIWAVPQQAQQTQQTQNVGYDPLLNPLTWSDWGLDTHAYLGGAALGRVFSPRTSGMSPDQRKGNKTADIFSAVGHLGKTGMGLFRGIASGYANQVREGQVMDNYYDRLRDSWTNAYQYAEEGGMVGGQNTKMVNVEDNEYIMHPDGSMSQVDGRTHEQGGEFMELESGTRILSDDAQIGAELAKKLREEYGIKRIYGRDTYSRAVEQMEKLLGMKQLKEDKEELDAKVEKEIETEHQATQTLNYSYLVTKQRELDEETRIKESQLEEFFEMLYKHQEEKKKPQDDQVMFEDGGEVKIEYTNEKNTFLTNVPKRVVDLFVLYGGRKVAEGEVIVPTKALNEAKDRFDVGQNATTEELLDKMVSREREIQRRIDSSKKTKSEVTEPVKQVTGTEESNSAPKTNEQEATVPTGEKKEVEKTTGKVVQEDSRIKRIGDYSGQSFTYTNPWGIVEHPTQHKDKGTDRFGGISNEQMQERLGWMYNYLPRLRDTLGLQKADDGTFSYDQNLVGTYQRSYNQYMQHNVQNLINRGLISEEDAQKYLGDITFTGDPNSARDFDEKMGQFTSTRSALRHQVLTPRELEQINELGVYTAYDATRPENREKIEAVLGADRMSDLDSIIAMGDYSDMVLDVVDPGTNITPTFDKSLPQINKTVDTSVIPSPEKKGKVEELKDINLGSIEKAIERAKARALVLPRQYYMPPSGLQPTHLEQVNLGRINPFEVTNEGELAEIGRMAQTSLEQVEQLPDSQRRAAIAAITANVNENIARSGATARQMNATNVQEALRHNIGLSATEQQANIVQRLGFEERQFTALGKTEADRREYINALERDRMRDYMTKHSMMQLDAMFPNYTMDKFGIMRHDPTEKTTLPGGARTQSPYDIFKNKKAKG